jgi:hypothetical protein
MLNSLLIERMKLTNLLEQPPSPNSLRSRILTRNFSLHHRKIELDSNRNLLPPRTTLPGTNSDKMKSTEKFRFSRTTNAIATNSLLDLSSTTKRH